MIKHIVFWRLKDSALGATKEQNARRLKDELEALRETVPGIHHLEVGIDFERSEAAWDVALYSEFETRAHLEAYQIDPEHEKVGQLAAQIREDRAVVDYEV
jgi:hypothetical protein